MDQSVSEPLQAAVILDYQNVFLTAHDIFGGSEPPYMSLIDPMKFAQRGILERNKIQKPGYPAAKLSRVFVFRGRPNADLEPNQHRQCQAQAENWRNSGVSVELRDLKYKFERDAEGKELTDVHGKRNSPVNLRKKVLMFFARLNA